MSTEWKESEQEDGVYEGNSRIDGSARWTATEVDLVFGSNSELRAVAEFYGLNESADRFINDFVGAWVKVMSLDRFDPSQTVCFVC